MTLLRIAWHSLRRILIGLRWLALLVLMLLVLRHATLQNTPYYQVAAHVRDAHFDYIGWELGAIRTKVTQAIAQNHSYTPEAERSDYVRAYFADLATVQGIEAQIEAIYTDPAVTDPDAESAGLRAERDTMRADLRQRQAAAEAILEDQVSTVLVEEGFGLGGQLAPPMSMRFVGRTLLLVTSPRDAIEMKYPMTLTPIPVDEREAIEQRIAAEQNLSAVIVPIGGMALYPAMIVETSSLSYTIETFAHEWLHHYLMFHPLGWSAELAESGEARIINETTASIFGREMGQKALERYYPEFVLPGPELPTSIDEVPTEAAPAEPTPPPFNFGEAMHETRTTVDDLLAEGKTEAAEAYMEDRRVLFYENGYNIRKLNQAWFAFYGGYQVEGINAGGADPTGQAVQDLRDSATNIKAWVVTMQTIVTRDDLLAERDRQLGVAQAANE
jgi:hypothetical protein